MEYEEKVLELARTLKNSGLAASLTEAEERARAILKPKTIEEGTVQEKLVDDKESPEYDISREEKTVAELMAEDDKTVYTKNEAKKEETETKAEEKEEYPNHEYMQNKDFMVKTTQELEEEKKL
jgi:hypothetical protein